MIGLKIIDPGLATSLQDRGRSGYLRFGVPACGAMDTDAMRLANALVGNEGGETVLEMRFLGPTLSVTAESARIAVVGASVGIRIERGGETVLFGENRSFLVQRDDRVTIGPLRSSANACLAVEGGFDLDTVLGSTARDAKSGIGGTEAKIEAATILPLKRNAVENRSDMALPDASAMEDEPVRVVLGPQDDYFTETSIETFLSTGWAVSQQADRMGMRLEGPVLKHSKGHDIASDGIANGAIQVPGSGQPIVLLADRQTSGGYPKIATVISCDLPRLGRMAPGDVLNFEAVDPATAIQLVRSHEVRMKALIDAIALYHPPGEVDLAALASGNIISAPIGME